MTECGFMFGRNEEEVINNYSKYLKFNKVENFKINCELFKKNNKGFNIYFVEIE